MARMVVLEAWTPGKAYTRDERGLRLVEIQEQQTYDVPRGS